MSKYNDQYYIATQPAGDEQLFVGGDKKSMKRGYTFQKVDLNDGPLFFRNDYRDEDREAGVRRDSLPDIMVDCAEIIVPAVLKEHLQRFPTYGMQLFPAVYVDDHGNYHDNRWHLNFYEQIPAIDVEKSQIDWDFSEVGTEYDCEKFSLSEEVLDKIPEEARLVFKIGQSAKSYVMIHQKVKDFIDEAGFTGLAMYKVSEFEEGRQFRG